MSNAGPTEQLPFLLNQRLSLLKEGADWRRCLHLDAFRAERDRGGFREEIHGKDSPWLPLVRKSFVEQVATTRGSRWLVVTDGGLGKTTNAHYLNFAIARDHPDRLSIFWPIHELPGRVDEFLTRFLDKKWRSFSGCGEDALPAEMAVAELRR